MGDRRLLGRLAREPLYNTRSVVQATGVPAETIRAWERRYGIPHPFRTPTNQRLYTEQDIGVINWLRDRTAEGMTISQAVQRLKLEVPDVFVADQPAELPAPVSDSEPQSIRLRQRLLDAAISFDTDSAERAIDDGLARYSVEAFCARFVEPTLQEIASRRRRGEVIVAVEHFAARLFACRLSAILTTVTPLSGRGTIIAASTPGGAGEVELLVLAIMLSRRGWQVVDLGASIAPDALVDAARTILPDLVCLCATTDQATTQARVVVQALGADFDWPVPVIVGQTVAEVVENMNSRLDPE